MVVVSKLAESKEYAPEDLKHLQNVLLMILKDFIELCDKHNITYFIDGGSALGCVRHNGFIPWDDDIDVILVRDQYEKFLEYSHELNDKYDILTMDNYEYYCRPFTKISLKGTKHGEIFDKNTDFEYGINIDIFVLDNMPNPGFKRKVFILQFEIFRKLLWAYELTTADIYLSKNKERIGHFMRFLLKLFNINNKTLKKMSKKLINKSKGIESNYYCSFGTPYSLMAFDKDIYSTTVKGKFETIKVNLSSGHMKYLKIHYGDNWMELPPEDKRTNHKYDGFDFGKY